MSKKKLLQYLKDNNRKYTIERDDMLEVIKKMEGIYSLNDLYAKAQKKGAIHAKSTLYRNLELFLDAGLIEKTEHPESNKIMYQTSTDFYADTMDA